MPIYIDFEKDTLYLRGEEKGLERGLEQSIRVINLLGNGIEPPMISKLLNLPFEYVECVVTECQKTQHTLGFSSN